MIWYLVFMFCNTNGCTAWQMPDGFVSDKLCMFAGDDAVKNSEGNKPDKFVCVPRAKMLY